MPAVKAMLAAMRMMSLIAALFLALALGACSHTPVAVAGDYVVAEIDGEQVETQRPITVFYDGEVLRGNGPINRWNFPISKEHRLGLGITTKMAGSEEMMKLEDKLLKALSDGKLVSRSDGVLIVEKGDTITVVMTPVDPTKSEVSGDS
ncbi:MAG: META domain-containing protein [Verrucomicrobiota bacterium]